MDKVTSDISNSVIESRKTAIKSGSVEKIEEVLVWWAFKMPIIGLMPLQHHHHKQQWPLLIINNNNSFRTKSCAKRYVEWSLAMINIINTHRFRIGVVVFSESAMEGPNRCIRVHFVCFDSRENSRGHQSVELGIDPCQRHKAIPNSDSVLDRISCSFQTCSGYLWWLTCHASAYSGDDY